MEKYRRLGVIGALALLALVVVSVATAASPREIYADYADNGRLDRTYSDSDLRNALNDAAVQGYGKPIVDRRLARRDPGSSWRKAQGWTRWERRAARCPSPVSTWRSSAAGGGFLLLLGWGLRRFARVRP